MPALKNPPPPVPPADLFVQVNQIILSDQKNKEKVKRAFKLIKESIFFTILIGIFNCGSIYALATNLTGTRFSLYYHSRTQELFPVNGHVYNSETGEPLVNANIIVPGTAQGASSGDGGWFEIMLPEGQHTLEVSSLGYSNGTITVTVPRQDRKKPEIGLIPDRLEIEGIDVVGIRTLPGQDTSITREPVSLLTSVTRISAAEIERQGAVTITDAVMHVPGGWTETRGRKTKQFFSVRGQTYPYPDYSINGIWQREFEETVYFFSAMDIESIEVVRSSSALVKGLSGLSGVVDVRTRMPEEETVSLLGRYGEQNNYVTSLRYGNKINDVSFSGSASFFGTDGPPARNGKERISTVFASGRWQVSPRLRVDAGGAFIGGLRQLVSIENPGAPNIAHRREQVDPMRSTLSWVKLDYIGDCGSLTELQANMAYRDFGYSVYNIQQQSATRHKELDWEYGINLLHSRPLSPSNTLRAGVLYNHWVAPEGKRFYVGRPGNVHIWSAVIANEQRIGRFLLDGGVRLIGGYIEEFGGFSIEGSAAGFQNVEPIMNEPSPLEWQSVLGATHILSPQSSLHYNFSGGTIAPRRGSIDEQGIMPASEIRLQHDLGFRHMTPRRDEISVSAFYISRNNALELSGETLITENDRMVELYHNIDKRSYGLELVTRVNLPFIHSFLFANATFMRGENLAGTVPEKDERLPNSVLNFGFQFDRSGFDVNLYTHYTGPYSNNRFVNRAWTEENGRFPLGDFTVVNLTAGYTFDRRFSTRVFAEARNMLDQRYLTVAGYPDSGRLFSLGARVNI